MIARLINSVVPGADQVKLSVKSNTNVLLYPCTIVGYVRLILLGGSLVWYLLSDELPNEAGFQVAFVIVVGLSLLLDILDGHLARKLNHTSKFGTLFDLSLDLITHTLVWTISGLDFVQIVIVLEWMGGLLIAAFSMQPEIEWKTKVVKSGRGLLKHYFGNNQRNIFSIYGNVCHFVFPTALYLGISKGWVYALSLPGVILYETVTVFLIIVLIKALIQLED